MLRRGCGSCGRGWRPSTPTCARAARRWWCGRARPSGSCRPWPSRRARRGPRSLARSPHSGARATAGCSRRSRRPASRGSPAAPTWPPSRMTCRAPRERATWCSRRSTGPGGRSGSPPGCPGRGAFAGRCWDPRASGDCPVASPPSRGRRGRARAAGGVRARRRRPLRRAARHAGRRRHLAPLRVPAPGHVHQRAGGPGAGTPRAAQPGPRGLLAPDRLAGVLPPPPRPPSRGRARRRCGRTCGPWRGTTTRPACGRGRPARPGSRWSTRACGSSPRPAGCTTAPAS